MKSRSKSNNFIAILIAILLFAIGFVLYFVHQQAQAGESLDGTQTGVTANMMSDGLIFEGHNKPALKVKWPISTHTRKHRGYRV